MAKISVLVDTDIFIDYFNTGRFSTLFDSPRFASRYSLLRHRHPSLEKGDALIAATVLVKQLPLLTSKTRHYRMVQEIDLFGEYAPHRIQTHRGRITCGIDGVLPPEPPPNGSETPSRTRVLQPAARPSGPRPARPRARCDIPPSGTRGRDDTPDGRR